MFPHVNLPPPLGVSTGSCINVAGLPFYRHRAPFTLPSCCPAMSPHASGLERATAKGSESGYIERNVIVNYTYMRRA